MKLELTQSGEIKIQNLIPDIPRIDMETALMDKLEVFPGKSESSGETFDRLRTAETVCFDKGMFLLKSQKRGDNDQLTPLEQQVDQTTLGGDKIRELSLTKV